MPYLDVAHKRANDRDRAKRRCIVCNRRRQPGTVTFCHACRQIMDRINDGGGGWVQRLPFAERWLRERRVEAHARRVAAEMERLGLGVRERAEASKEAG